MVTNTTQFNGTFTNVILNDEMKAPTVLNGLRSSYYDDPDRYIPVTLKDIRFGPYSGIDLYMRTSNNNKSEYVLFCRGEGVCENEKGEYHVRRNIHRLFIPKNGKTRYLQYVEANLRNIIADKADESNVKLGAAYEVGINIAHDIFSGNKAVNATINRAKNWVFLLVDFIINNDDVTINLINTLYHEEELLRHSVTSALTGLLFAKHNGLDICSMNSLGLGLLLHDAGMARMQRYNSSINHAADATDSDDPFVWQHPLIGASLLEKATKFDPEVLQIILHHHEYIDGTGYPHKLKEREINHLAKYVRIVDEYDLMMARERENDSRKRHFNVLNNMANRLKYKLDMELLINFIRFLGASYKDKGNNGTQPRMRFQDNRPGDGMAARMAI